MKKIFCFFCAMFLCYGFLGIATASLIPLGNGTIKDDTNNLLWHQDLTDFTPNMNYDAQVSEILSVCGPDWHMALQSEMTALFNSYDYDDIDGIFTPTFALANGYTEYIGRFDSVSAPNEHYYGGFYVNSDGSGYEHTGTSLPDSSSSAYIGAWAVKTVPIPGAVWLLGSGLIGIVRIRRKHKK